jgi:hypothetical protein
VDKTGASVSFSSHAFSENGRYLAIRYNKVAAVVDLQNLSITPVGYFTSWSTSSEISVSSDGRYIGVDNSGLYVFDATNCQRKYTYPNWDLAQFQQDSGYIGCSKSQNLVPILQSSSSAGANLNFFQRLHFSDDSSTFFVGGGVRKSGAPINSSSTASFDWREYSFKPDLYQSTTQGYLAMGDSFSSGEGDLEGGTWYEPGTDEQGNKATFENRNLCHLSRRSYPYLIAKELGYLDGPLDSQITPESDGFFHSIACSGAVIRNIIGGSDRGTVSCPSEQYVFKLSNNQYCTDFTGLLDNWQPGRVRQLDFFNPVLGGYSETDQKPEVITIGIGGNDAGFGDVIQACTNVGTCPQAEHGSPEAGQLAFTIAMLKPKLVDTYKKVKQASPESRVYVHGYPIFIKGTGGNCGNNVHLDFKETAMVEEGIKYTNAVVEASAREAGVFYVDVSNILSGVNLCSEAEDRNMAFNGATAGNDIDSTLANVLSLGICIPRTGCLGNESFHPNALGHQRYKQTILSQTDNFQATIPDPQPTNFPIPNALVFGTSTYNTVNSFNGNNPDTSIPIPDAKSFLGLTSTGKLSINQMGLFAGSTAIIEAHSTPQVIGSAVIPANGELSVEYSLPDNLEPGVHQIHIFGIDENGNKVDYYQNILIGGSPEDFDSDGVINTEDSCPILENSFIDLDSDGIDDACDLEVVVQEETPPEQPTEEIPEDQEPDDDPAEYIDKGTPSVETVAGNEQTVISDGSVLGVSTVINNKELSSTGAGVAVILITGLIISTAGLLTRKHAQGKYRIYRR